MPFKVLILTSALASVNPMYYNAARVDGTSRFRKIAKITLPMISPMVFYLIITGFIGAFKAYSDAVALFGTNLNAAEMNTIVGYVYDMLYGDSGGYPSYASAAAILLFAIVLTITCINLLVSKKHVHYVYRVKGSCSMLLLSEDGSIIAARDKWGRTPIVIGRKEGAYAATSESSSFPNLDYEIDRYLGPGEIVRMTADGVEQLRKPEEKMQICSFLWVYYGFPTSCYEGRNVEEVRFTSNT